MNRVRDVMTARVITLSPADSIECAVETLVEHRISGAPVVDAEGRLLGLLTEFQLLKIASFPSLKNMSVSDLMTKAVWVISEDAPLSEAADLLARHRIRRLPVVREGRVVGVVSRRDVIRHLLASRQAFLQSEEFPHICKRLMTAIGFDGPTRRRKRTTTV